MYLIIYTPLLFEPDPKSLLTSLSRYTASSIESSSELVIPDCLLSFLVGPCPVGTADTEADKRKRADLVVYLRRMIDDNRAGNAELEALKRSNELFLMRSSNKAVAVESDQRARSGRVIKNDTKKNEKYIYIYIENGISRACRLRKQRYKREKEKEDDQGAEKKEKDKRKRKRVSEEWGV